MHKVAREEKRSGKEKENEAKGIQSRLLSAHLVLSPRQRVYYYALGIEL